MNTAQARRPAESGTSKADSTKGMARSLGAVIKKVKTLWAAAERHNGMARYEIGEKVREVDASPEKFGKEAVKKMADKLGKSRSLVYSYGAVAKTFSRGELRTWLKRAEGRLLWSHLVLLSMEGVNDELRDELIKRIVTEGMTVAALKTNLPSSAKTEEIEQEDFEAAPSSEEPSPERRFPVTVMHVPTEERTIRVPVIFDEAAEQSERGVPALLRDELAVELDSIAEKAGLLADQARMVEEHAVRDTEGTDPSSDDAWLDALTKAKATTEELAQACAASVKHLEAAIAAHRGTRKDLPSAAVTIGDTQPMRLLPSGETVSQTPALADGEAR